MRTHEGKTVFEDEAVALNVFLLVRQDPRTLAAVLMPDQLHWVLCGVPDLAMEMMRFKRHASARARSAGYEGKVWQRSFFEAAISGPEALPPLVPYLLVNPIAAGIVAKWQDYPWAFLHSSLGG